MSQRIIAGKTIVVCPECAHDFRPFVYRDHTKEVRCPKCDVVLELDWQYEPCICCGKPVCDGHDGDAWKRCAKRYREWSLQTERRCLALLRQHGLDAPSPTKVQP